MKKIIASLFAFVLVFAFAVLGFSGCTNASFEDPVISETNIVTEEQWDSSMSLFWKNLTFEYTYKDNGVSKTQKLELLADGSLHQSGQGWGEKFVKYSNSKWKVYGEGGVPTSMEYSTEEDYIDGNYGDDIGFMSAILPKLEGEFDEFTYNETTKEYVAENYYFIVYGTEGYNVNITAKFEGGNLTKISFGYGYEEADFEVIFYDYGTTTIDFPESIS